MLWSVSGYIMVECFTVKAVHFQEKQPTWAGEVA
jgi:hypothetical protein